MKWPHPYKTTVGNVGYSHIFGPLTILFCPSGVYLAPTEPLQPDQVNELAVLGAALVKLQGGSHAHSVPRFR